jgi:hypothetical protein
MYREGGEREFVYCISGCDSVPVAVSRKALTMTIMAEMIDDFLVSSRIFLLYRHTRVDKICRP